MAQKINPDEWEKYKAIILSMRREGVKVKGSDGIVGRMYQEHGFRTTKWQDIKKLPKLEWYRIISIVDQYKRTGRNCSVRWNGKVIPKTKLDRKRRECKHLREHRVTREVSENDLPEGITISTGTSPLSSDNMACVEDQRNVIPVVESQSAVAAEIKGGSAQIRNMSTHRTDMLGAQSQRPSTHLASSVFQESTFKHTQTEVDGMGDSMTTSIGSVQPDTIALLSDQSRPILIGGAIPDLSGINSLDHWLMSSFDERILQSFTAPNTWDTQGIWNSTCKRTNTEEVSSSAREAFLQDYGNWQSTPHFAHVTPLTTITDRMTVNTLPSSEIQLPKNTLTASLRYEGLSKFSSVKASLAALLPPDNVPITDILVNRNSALQQAFASPSYRILISSIENNFAGLDKVPIEEISKLLRQDDQMRSNLLQYLQQTPKALACALVEKLVIIAIEDQDALALTELLDARLIDIDKVVCTFQGSRYTAVQRAVMLPCKDVFWALLSVRASITNTFDRDLSILKLALQSMLQRGEFEIELISMLLDHMFVVTEEILVLALDSYNMELINLLLSRSRRSCRRQIPRHNPRAQSESDRQCLCDSLKYMEKFAKILTMVITKYEQQPALEIIHQIWWLYKFISEYQRVEYSRSADDVATLSAELGYMDVLQLLLPIMDSKSGPLAAAIRNRNESLIQLVWLTGVEDFMKCCTLEKGNYITTPLAEAIRSDDPALLSRFENNSFFQIFWSGEQVLDFIAFEITLKAACELGNLEYCRKLVSVAKKSQEIADEVNTRWFCPLGLHIAVEKEHYHVAWYLLEAGACVTGSCAANNSDFSWLGWEMRSLRSYAANDSDFFWLGLVVMRSLRRLRPEPRQHCLFQSLIQRKQDLFERLLECDINLTEDLGAQCAVYALEHQIGWAINGLFSMRPSNEEEYLSAIFMEASRTQLRVNFDHILLEYNLPIDLTQLGNSGIWKQKILLRDAILSNNLRVVQELLDSGSDPFQALEIALQPPKRKRSIDDTQETRYLDVSSRILLSILQAFRKIYPNGVRGFGCRGLLHAIQIGDTELLKEMLEAKLDTNAREGPENALSAAIQKTSPCKLEIIRNVLQAGGDVKGIVFLEGFKRMTALLQGIYTKSRDVVELLIEYGADPHQVARYGLSRTPLQAACEVGSTEIVDLLLGHGADVNEPPAYRRGATALQLCAIKGYVGIALKLLNLGADVHAPPSTTDGRTPLQGAAENGRLDMISMLWKHTDGCGFGPDDCKTAMEMAEKNGHIACRDLVKELRGKI